jgi:hypothetical protein
VRRRLAMYTTVYDGVQKYLKEWYTSVHQQTDHDFDLYIGCDRLQPSELELTTRGPVRANWVLAANGDTPVQLRERALRQILRNSYDAVIFVDADDILHPTRVEAARENIQKASVGGCALEAITETGESTGFHFGPTGPLDFSGLLPRCNFFGMSNSVYRTDVLLRCLPVPAGCAIMDWFLVTRAWAAGAELMFDDTCRMYYRQHSANVARILPPFSVEYAKKATKLVQLHYVAVLNHIPELPEGIRKNLITAYERVQAFQRSVVEDEGKLTEYADALNQLPPTCTWWTCVAHPELEHLWNN